MPARKQTILIVDDQRLHIRMLSAVLEKDHGIVSASDGQQALEIARSEPPPDLILLDISMPGIDGYEVCRQLKQDDATRRIPVIFATAKDEVEDETRGFELGAVDYVQKPFKLPVVCARVRTHLRLKRQTELLESLVTIDGLTEIPNRRRFDEQLERDWGRCTRNQLPLSVIIADVDYFKRFNDHYGHAAGDDCLCRVAAALAGSAKRSNDLVARYGGEEFVAILSDTGLSGAQAVAHRMRAAVEELQIPHAKSDAAQVVTVSVGGATLVPDPEVPNGDGLVKAADDNLYSAKKAGRNQVVYTQA